MDEPPTGLEHGERTRVHLTADGVEYDIAVFDRLGEVLFGVVDGFVRAQVTQVAVVDRTAGDDHMGADVACVLHRETGKMTNKSLCSNAGFDHQSGPGMALVTF